MISANRVECISCVITIRITMQFELHKLKFAILARDLSNYHCHSFIVAHAILCTFHVHFFILHMHFCLLFFFYLMHFWRLFLSLYAPSFLVFFFFILCIFVSGYIYFMHFWRSVFHFFVILSFLVFYLMHFWRYFFILKNFWSCCWFFIFSIFVTKF